MSRNPDRPTIESFRPDDGRDGSVRPPSGAEDPEAPPEPVDVGGPSIVDIPKPKPARDEGLT